MKNKNTTTANQLVDKILELQKAKGTDSGTRYAFATGTLISILQAAARDHKSVQEQIESTYRWISEEYDKVSVEA